MQILQNISLSQIKQEHQSIIKPNFFQMKQYVNSLKEDMMFDKTTSLVCRMLHPWELLQLASERKVISRAYFKMYEILKTFNLIDFKDDSINSFHLCEAPGSFIQALSDFIKDQQDEKKEDMQIMFDWGALTLDENDKQGLSWKYCCKHFQQKLLLGDVHKPVDSWLHTSFDLVTGDGGFFIEPHALNEQEQICSSLISAQVSRAIELLQPGGHFVLKLFDCFEKKTHYILWKIIHHFEEVYLVKPHASRVCNSEKYIVAKYFLGKNQSMGDVGNDLYFSFENFLFKRLDPFVKLQTEYLQKAAHLSQIIRDNSYLYPIGRIWAQFRKGKSTDKEALERSKKLWRKLTSQ